MQPENNKPKESKLFFLEKASWRQGQEIITVLLADEHGRKHNVAHIYLQYSKEPVKKAFVVSDAKGMGMLPPSDDLAGLKKMLIALEPHLKEKLKTQQLNNTRSKNSSNEKEITR